jgi:hypothetical protein
MMHGQRNIKLLLLNVCGQIATFWEIKKYKHRINNCTKNGGGTGSVVGIATANGLDGPGIESRWGRGFPHLSTPALRPTQPPVQWVPSLSRG